MHPLSHSLSSYFSNIFFINCIPNFVYLPLFNDFDILISSIGVKYNNCEFCSESIIPVPGPSSSTSSGGESSSSSSAAGTLVYWVVDLYPPSNNTCTGFPSGGGGFRCADSSLPVGTCCSQDDTTSFKLVGISSPPLWPVGPCSPDGCDSPL